MSRNRVQADSPGSESETEDTVSATFGAAFSAFLKPLKEDVDANESTAIASFLREAHNLNSQRAIMEAFVGPVIAHLGKNLLSDLWDGDVDDMTVDEVKAMNVSLLRRWRGVLEGQGERGHRRGRGRHGCLNFCIAVYSFLL